jgi:hypothetical protein
LASFRVSVPDPGGRLASGPVRDDTVSTDGLLPVTALRSAFVTLVVSFPLVWPIRVARQLGAWQPATRTAPGGAGRRGGIVLP